MTAMRDLRSTAQADVPMDAINSRAIATLGEVGHREVTYPGWHIDPATREIGQDIGLGGGPGPSSSTAVA